jgi:branched-chain amino acid transport system ATP-binding protein
MIFFMTENIGIHFGGLNAVSNIFLEVIEGETHGIIGPNGAGKTTLFNIISGIYAATSGKVIFLGKDVTRLKPHQISNLGIARTFQKSELFAGMTVLENVMTGFHRYVDSNLSGIILGTKKTKRIEDETKGKAHVLLKFVGMKGYENDVAVELPFGKQRLVEIARSLATRPRLLLLDEPVAGANPKEAVGLSEIINQIRKVMGITIIIIEHTIDFIFGISDRITVLSNGEIIAQGNPGEIKENEKVKKAYLGEEGK